MSPAFLIVVFSAVEHVLLIIFLVFADFTVLSKSFKSWSSVGKKNR